MKAEETGLDYFGARYYSGAQGRFTSPDPRMAGAELLDPQSWNGYSYALNNPLKFVDPDGEAPWFATALLGGGLSAGSTAFQQWYTTGSVRTRDVAVAFGTVFVTGAITPWAVATRAVQAGGIIGQAVVAGGISAAGGASNRARDSDAASHAADPVQVLADASLAGLGETTGSLLGQLIKRDFTPIRPRLGSGSVSQHVSNVRQWRETSRSVAQTADTIGAGYGAVVGGGLWSAVQAFSTPFPQPQRSSAIDPARHILKPKVTSRICADPDCHEALNGGSQ